MATSPNSFAITPGAQNTECTVPNEQLCHYIRDDELDRLGEMRKDFVMEICLAASGVFFGTIVPAYDGFSRFGNQTDPATATDLVSMMLCVASFAISVVTGYQWRVRSNSHKDMVTEIRNRPKIPVVTSNDQST